MGPKYIGVMTLTYLGHVTSSFTLPFESQWVISYWWSIGPKSISPAVFKIFGPKYIEARPWPFRVRWRHRSRDHSNPNGSSPIGGPLDPSLYLRPFSRYLALSILRSGPNLSGSRDVITHVTIRIPMGHLILVVHWTQASISNGFRDIVPQTSCAHRHNAKSSLRMRVTRDMYPYVKFKYIFQFLEHTLPIHYATFIGLRWRIRGVLSLTSNVKGQNRAKIF